MTNSLKALEDKGYKLFRVRDTNAYIAYSKSAIAYSLSLIITKSKFIANKLREIGEKTNSTWFEQDLTDEEKENLNDRKRRIHKEISIVSKYIQTLEKDDYKKLRSMADNLKLDITAYTMLKTKFCKDIQMYKYSMFDDIWIIDFSNLKTNSYAEELLY